MSWTIFCLDSDEISSEPKFSFKNNSDTARPVCPAIEIPLLLINSLSRVDGPRPEDLFSPEPALSKTPAEISEEASAEFKIALTSMRSSA